eukprot:TRINITY_DN7835_c0_g1_i2.p1 TRINITY_DN7835_c0_g1~~TRINITY_DN7835_c0_g1_i2.p1  ORF type:complete len:910 (+),score=161.15 TRINITY_DN7835_c0_g1_i2:140-2869(+)
MKQKQLEEEEESPVQVNNSVHNYPSTTPYKYTLSESVPIQIAKAPGSFEAKGVSKPFQQQTPSPPEAAILLDESANLRAHHLPPDPRPPPSFYQKLKLPSTSYTIAQLPPFYDGEQETRVDYDLDDEYDFAPPVGLRHSQGAERYNSAASTYIPNSQTQNWPQPAGINVQNNIVHKQTSEQVNNYAPPRNSGVYTPYENENPLDYNPQYRQPNQQQKTFNPNYQPFVPQQHRPQYNSYQQSMAPPPNKMYQPQTVNYSYQMSQQKSYHVQHDMMACSLESDAGIDFSSPTSDYDLDDEANFIPDLGEKAAQLLKKQLQLSPISKQQFTDFFKVFKVKEKEGYYSAKQYASSNFANLPPKVHWKVYLEMADLAKRENRHKEARKYYEAVNKIQPYACKGWLEFAKMEEESGNLHECTKILADGLYFCPHSEGLLVKGIKHSERMGNIQAARALLSRLKNVAIERSWRTMMEGGLLEARQGNVKVAREIFKYLMEKVPSYGPIYTEAVRLEMRMEEYPRALKLVEKGLSRIPSYGPLWFLALKIEERLDKDYNKRVEEGVPHLSKELVWKIYFELAQIEERKGNREKCNRAYVQSVLNCPSKNLVWKIWLGGARTELHRNNIDAARKLLVRALQTVPAKMKATALLECARFEEFLGYLNDARYVLQKAKKETKHEWKVFLESVLLEMRANNLEAALEEVNEALEVHSSTGRLWAVLIQLTHLLHLTEDNVNAQILVFRRALNNVPKSGEVWCEGARIALHQGQLEQARKYLDFAIQFTPQYGDSFIEQMRLELLCHIKNNHKLDSPEVKASLDKLELACLNAEPTYGVCWTYCKQDSLDSARQTLRNAKARLMELVELRSKSPQTTTKMSSLEKQLCHVYSSLDVAASFFAQQPSVHNNLDTEFKFRAIFS